MDWRSFVETKTKPMRCLAIAWDVHGLLGLVQKRVYSLTETDYLQAHYDTPLPSSSPDMVMYNDNHKHARTHSSSLCAATQRNEKPCLALTTPSSSPIHHPFIPRSRIGRGLQTS
jgi:hypothetical protein